MLGHGMALNVTLDITGSELSSGFELKIKAVFRFQTLMACLLSKMVENQIKAIAQVICLISNRALFAQFRNSLH